MPSCRSAGGINCRNLQYYWKNVCGLTSIPTVVPVPVGTNKAIPKFTGSGEDTENTLDLELCGGCAYTAILLFISAPNTNTGFYEAFSAAIAGGIVVNGVTYNPSIISCSWGLPEPEMGATNMTVFNNLFQQAATKGITICCATGDNGATDGYSSTTPTADFPASAPYALACGGSSLQSVTSGTTTTITEVAWSWSAQHEWGAGSGASSQFAMPSWQDSVAVLPSGTAPSDAKYQGKRVLPDIVLNANPSTGYTIYMGGKVILNEIGGTSCAAPMMAGLLGALNIKYTAPFGQYLYTIYANASQRSSVFKDITSGSNDNLAGKSVGMWSAGLGYDYLTGCGSLNGGGLKAALAAAGLGGSPSAVVVLGDNTKGVPNSASLTPIKKLRKKIKVKKDDAAWWWATMF